MVGISISIIFSSFYDSGKKHIYTLFFLIGLSLTQLSIYSKGNSGEAEVYVLLVYLILLLLVFFIISPLDKVLKKRVYINNIKHIDQRLGNLSYPIYINQYAITVLFLSFIAKPLSEIGSFYLPYNIFMYVLFNCVVITISASLIYMTDIATNNFRNKVRGHKIS